MRFKIRAILLGPLLFVLACGAVAPVEDSITPTLPALSTATNSVPELAETLAALPSPTSMPTPMNSLSIGEIIAVIPVGPMPGGNLAIGEGSVWVPNAGNGTISRIDPQTNQVVATIEIGERGGSYGSPLAVAVIPGAVWVTDNAGFALVRIDPGTNEIVARLPLERLIAGVHRPVEPYYLTANAEAVWVTGLDFDTVIRVDTNTNEMIASFKVPSPSGIAIGADAVWVANHRQGTLTRIHSQTNEVIATIDVPDPSPEAIAIGEGAVWVTDSTTGTVTRIDPETNQVIATTPSVGARANGIVIGGGAIWVTCLAKGTLTKIDPMTNQIVGTLDISPAVGIAFGEEFIWVGDIENSSVLRIMPLP